MGLLSLATNLSGQCQPCYSHSPDNDGGKWEISRGQDVVYPQEGSKQGAFSRPHSALFPWVADIGKDEEQKGVVDFVREIERSGGTLEHS
jgi:hypothetical protein